MPLNAEQRHALGWAAVVALVGTVLWLLAPVLTPFIVGAVLAYALQPAVELLVRRRVPRALAVVLVVLLTATALLGLLLLIVPILSKEIPLLKEQIPLLAERLNASLVPWLAQFGIKASLDVESIKAFVLKYLNANLEDWFGTVLASARIGGSFVLAIVGNLVLVPVVLVFLLLDWPRVVAHVQGLVPPRMRARVNGFLDECDAVLGQYLRGQLAVMLVLAVYYSVALTLAGLDLALPVGVFTGLAIFVPYLGIGLGLLLALTAALLQFPLPYALGMVALIYGAGQLGEGLFLTPRMVGERIGLSPLAVIFALLAFGHLLGFVGVLVALPASAVAVVAVRRAVAWYRGSSLFGQ